MSRRYEVEPWTVRETYVDADDPAEAESVFALGNGLVGVRGTLDENQPYGTYLNSFYEETELSYPEDAYGQPERTQIVVCAPDGTGLRLAVDGHRLDVRTGTVRHHERVLDLRAGVLERTVEWQAPRGGGAVRVRSTRLVSFTHPAVVAVRYRVEALGPPVTLLLDSDLRANADPPGQDSDDPRAPTVLRDPLVGEHFSVRGLRHRTRVTGQRVSVAVTHLVEGADSVEMTTGADLVRAKIRARLASDGALTVIKFVAYATGAAPDADPALDAAVEHGWDALVADQRAYLDAFWDDADIELDGDPPVEQAVRFGLFHVLQATAAAGRNPVPAKGLTGNGYDGHTLWDTELFVLPLLTFVRPDAAADALRWRHSTVDLARERARELRLAGAAFPWRTIGGRECSGYWPAGSAALHINADLASAVLCYATATGDDAFMREAGVELLVETARLWQRVGYHDDSGAFHIDGVTGPDEYTAFVDDNLYTNVMARRNLLGAVDAVRRFGFSVADGEIAAWEAAANAMHLPYDDKRGVYQQCAGFTDRQEWDFADSGYPLLLHHPYQVLYPRQVVKQADAVLAMQVCDESFSFADKARTFAYYERITVRDSSLSASSQAVLAAELGHLDLAHAYLKESALHDLCDLSDTTEDGLHIAALAGAWTILVVGFGGFRHSAGRPAFAPRLPGALRRMRFSVRWRGRRIRVTVTRDEVEYLLRDAHPRGTLDITHHGEGVTLHPGEPVTRFVPELADPGPTPGHPPGRGPFRETNG